MILQGTLVNIAAVVGGCLIGRLAGRYLSAKSVGGQGGQTIAFHGLWFVFDDAGLSDDGLPGDAVVGTGRHDGDRLFIDPRGDVALGGLYRRRETAGNRLRGHDPDPTTRCHGGAACHRFPERPLSGER